VTTITAPSPSTWSPMPGAHYLHPQRSTRVPRRYVFIDTEAYRDTGPDEELQTWRLGVSACVKWRPQSGTWSPVVPVRHDTPEDLWREVTEFARKDARTVVVAHNMAYDLRISRGLEVLPQMGWDVTKLSLTARHITVDLERDHRHLVLVDSTTVVPRTMATIGDWKGDPKPVLPANDAPECLLWDRCVADVELLAWAYMEVVDWLRRDDLGCWARTGAGMGWSTMLRGFLRDGVLVHGDSAHHELEGRSSYAGRCEVWRWGKQTAGPFTEWDYELAYAGVMRDESLPTVYQGQVFGVPVADMVATSATDAYLCQARVETTAPVLPWRDDRGVLWPVGRFEGFWWHWELAAAIEAGAAVELGWAHHYRSSPWLADWAWWVTELVSDRSSGEARVRGAVAKHWQRSLVGRSAMRYAAWEERGEAWEQGLHYWPLVQHETGKRGAAVMLGNRRFEAWEQRFWDSALPQLLSSVMAHCRVRLWRAMAVAGHSHLVYLDSDCLVTDPVGSARLAAATAAGELPGLRIKGVHPDLCPIAPQLIEGSTYRKLAGVPRAATRTGEYSYDGERWEGIKSTLAGGSPGSVKVAKLHQTIRPTDWRRAHLDGGRTRPYEVIDGTRELPATVRP
jgi:hypothetical protein